MKFRNLFTFLLSLLSSHERALRPNRQQREYGSWWMLPKPSAKNNIVIASMVGDVGGGRTSSARLLAGDEKWIFHIFCFGLLQRGDICGINIYLWVRVGEQVCVVFYSSRRLTRYHSFFCRMSSSSARMGCLCVLLVLWLNLLNIACDGDKTRAPTIWISSLHLNSC